MVNSALQRLPLLFVPGLVSAGLESRLLGRRLASRGIELAPYLHQARRETPETIAARLGALLEENPDVHLIGHSFGGLLALAAMENASNWGGRAVLLGPPLAGSVAARRVMALPGGRQLLGAAGRWLEAPPSPRVDPSRIAVIAGSRDLGLGRLLGLGPGSTDSLVHVDETRIPGATHVQLPVTHLGLLLDPRVADTTARFIRTGSVNET